MVLHLTSLVLGTNAIHALLKQYWIYGLAFTGITLSSVLYHTSTKRDSSGFAFFWFDQACIYTVFFVGFYYFLNISKSLQTAAIVSISLVMFYYFYGYYTTDFCWNPEHGDLYHGFMHVAGSLGHHAIMAGLP